MSQSGRGGPPSEFISRTLSSELFKGRQDSSDDHSGLSRDSQDADTALAPITGLPIRDETASSLSLAPTAPTAPSAPAPTANIANIANHPHLPIFVDLRKSGLEPRDMLLRTLETPEKTICGIPSKGTGYVIPYFDISGIPIPFYRCRVLNADFTTNGIKYKQPRKSPNHVYFPRNFRKTLQRWINTHPHERFLLIVEGEKKAACADKMGFPCIGLGGVDSWRSRTIVLPQDTEFYTTPGSIGSSSNHKGEVRAKLPSSHSSVPELVTLARGFGDFLDTMTQHDLTPVIIFDSDNLGTIKSSVQRAATMLAYELVYLGIHSNRVKQVVLPAVNQYSSEVSPGDETGIEAEAEAKTGLDDYIMQYGPDELHKLISAAMDDPQAFPRHPNPKGFISTKLQERMDRKVLQQVASMILTELDASGQRMYEKESGNPFYYDRETHVLLPATMIDKKGKPLHETPFGTLLYRKFGISANDNRVLTWLASQFTGEDPITEVIPRRVITLITEREDQLNPRGLAIQISDSQFLAVSPDPNNPLTVCNNGFNGIMFERDQVDPLDIDLVLECFEQQLSEAKDRSAGKPYICMENWWREVLDDSNIGLEVDGSSNSEDEDEVIQDVHEHEHESGAASSSASSSEISEIGIRMKARLRYNLTEIGGEMRKYASLLYYISPFLFRWRGLQLPVEMTVGSPGSGKSSLYALRLNILTGRPKLRNIPTDIRDWQASVANSGGLHVTDNVHFLNRELKQRISDELCRITTEPNPVIEMRKFYTETDQVTIPVNTVFAFTAISTPFQNEDLIQRSVTFQTGSVGREPKGDWVSDKIHERGGREAWMAHHLLFLHLFFRQEWNDTFHTQHRLAHLEQSLLTASRVFSFRLPTRAELESVAHAQAKRDAQSKLVLQAAHRFADADAKAAKVLDTIRMQDEKTFGSFLKVNQAEQMMHNDWVMRGVRDFCEYWKTFRAKRGRLVVSDITNWASAQESYCENEILTNTFRMGRYMSQNVSTLASVLNLYPDKPIANRSSYRIYGKSQLEILSRSDPAPTSTPTSTPTSEQEQEQKPEQEQERQE